MIKTLLGILLLAVTVQYVFKILYAFHYMKSSILYHHSPGPCLQLPGAEGGSEDLQVLEDGRTFISSVGEVEFFTLIFLTLSTKLLN